MARGEKTLRKQRPHYILAYSLLKYSPLHIFAFMPKYLIKSRLVWLTFMLLGIVPLLAFLQWQWIDDLARHEEERLQNTLNVASMQLSFSFNQRLFHVQQAFFARLMPENISYNDREKTFSNPTRFSDIATTAWHSWQYHHHEDVGFVESLYYALPPSDKAENWTIAHYDTTTHILVKSNENRIQKLNLNFAVMPPFSRIIGNLEAIIIPLSLNGFQDRLPPKRSPMQPQEELNEPIMPTAMSQTVYAIVMLNKMYIQTRLFPALLREHLASHRLQYDCGIIRKESSQSAPELVLSSSPELKVTDFEHSAVSLPIGLLPPRPNGRFAKMMGTRPPSMPPGGMFMSGKMNMNRMNMSRMTGMLSAAGLDSTITRKFFGDMELRVQYKPNALKNEILRIRWRNLSLSFGALVVLGAGLVLVVMAVTRSERLQRQQMQFVAGISHEFRTPLAVLSSAGENLADGIVTNPEQIKRYGNVMKREITRLAGMVEQTLSFAGIQAGRHSIDPKPVSVQSLVEQAMMRHRGLLEEENFATEIQIPTELPPVLADATALATVLDNLIINAVKYSTTQRKLYISAIEKGSMVLILVQDAGRGIPSHEIAHVFEPFFRSHEVTDAQIHGNGLGLAIVQHIITQHGGTITVKSEVGSGTTFTISLKKG